MFRKLKKIVLLSMAVSITVMAAVPMSAFAQRFNFYQEDLHGMYDNYIVPRFRRVNGNWPVGWISKFTSNTDVDKNNYYLNQPVTDVITADRYLLPTSKAFINKVGSTCLGNAYYIFDTVGTDMYNRKYIALDQDVCGNDDKEVYYVRWIMYVPTENSVENLYDASRMTLAFHSSYTDNDSQMISKSRYEAGVHYKYSNGIFEKAELMFFQRGNVPNLYQSNYPDANENKWTYASDDTGIQTGYWYNCLLKISAVKDSYTNTEKDENGEYTATNTAEFKMWKYGADEPNTYSLTCTFKPKHGRDNIVILRPYAYGISGNVLNGVSDFQVDGYTNDDINNAEAVFAAAQAWNPDLATLSDGISSNNIDTLNNAMASAAMPTEESGVTVTYALNRPNDAYLSVDAQSGTFTLNSSPKHWREYALEATFEKGNAVTRKSYPIGVLGALDLKFYTEQRVVAEDGKYQCQAVVQNGSNSISIQPAIILASYDSTGRIIGELHGAAEQTIAAGDSWTYDFTGLNIDGAVKVRAFLWNGIDDPTPLCDYEETTPPPASVNE